MLKNLFKKSPYFMLASKNTCCNGNLVFMADEETGRVFIHCDDCYVEYDNPSDAINEVNDFRNKYKKIRPATLEEITSMGWADYISKE